MPSEHAQRADPAAPAADVRRAAHRIGDAETRAVGALVADRSMSKASDSQRIALTHRAAAPGDAIKAQLELERPAIVAKLIELAKLGDPRSIETALKWLAPVARPDAERVDIPNFKQAATLQQKADAVIAAIATGHCSAEAGERLLRVLDVYARAVVADDHERRLAAIEAGKTPVLVVERVEDTFDDLA